MGSAHRGSMLGQHGFQSTRFNGGFLLFDKDTDGRSGRRILIDSRLANKFSALVNHDSKGQLVIAGIKQLKAKGGGINSNSCYSKPQRHMDVIGHVLVTYEIHQSSFDDPYGGLRIVDLDVADFAGSREPEFYHVRYTADKKWHTKDLKIKTSVKTHKAAINGLVPDFIYASKTLMPEMVEKSYGDAKAEGFDFFYQPQSLIRRGLSWRTPSQKRVNIKVASDRLAKGLLEAQKRQHSVQWVIHGDGASLFARALEQLKGQKLNQHEVLFAGIPRENLAPILQTVQRSEIKLHKDIIKNNGHDWLSVNNRVDATSSLYRVMENLGEEYEERLGALKHQISGDRRKVLGQVTASFSMGMGLPHAPAVAAQAVSTLSGEPLAIAAALGAGALGAIKGYEKLKSFRNVASNHRNNANLNPHMHPFKSAPEFEHHVTKANGGQLNSFLALIGLKRG